MEMHFVAPRHSDKSCGVGPMALFVRVKMAHVSAQGDAGRVFRGAWNKAGRVKVRRNENVPPVF